MPSIQKNMITSVLFALLLCVQALWAAESQDLVDQLILLKDDPTAFFKFAQQHNLDGVAIAQTLELKEHQLKRLIADAALKDIEGTEKLLEHFSKTFGPDEDLDYIMAKYRSFDFMKKFIDSTSRQRILAGDVYTLSVVAGAAANQNPRVLIYFLDKFPELAQLTVLEHEMTIGHIVCKAGTLESILMLIERFPDLIAKKDKNLLTILCAACENDNPHVLDALLKDPRTANLMYETEIFGRWLLHLIFQTRSLKNLKNTVQLCPQLLQRARQTKDVTLLFAALDNPDANVFDYCLSLPEVSQSALSIEPRTGESLLHQVCRNGNIRALSTVLELFPELKKYKDRAGANFFFAALASTNDEVLDYLFSQKDCLPYAQKKLANGDTLLHAAARSHTVAKVEKIMKYCPDLISKTGSGGATILESAVSNPDTQIFHFLRKRPEFTGMLSQKNKNGMTILHAACKKSSLGVITAIMILSPDLVATVDNMGHNMFHSLTYNTDREVLHYFFSNKSYEAGIMHTSVFGSTVAHTAVLVGSLAALDMILTYYPKFADALDGTGKSIVEIAVYRDDAAAIRYFIENPKFSQLFAKRGTNNETILHRACMYGCLETVKLLLERFPDYNQLTDDRGRGVWHYALANKRPKVLDFLIDSGFEPDDAQAAQTKREFFTQCCKNDSHEELVNLLQRYGSNYIEKTLSKKVIAAILKHHGPLETVCQFAPELVHYGDATRKTLLHHALIAKKTDFAKVLLKHNADLFAKDDAGVSCASIARKQNQADIIQFAARLKLGREILNKVAKKDDFASLSQAAQSLNVPLADLFSLAQISALAANSEMKLSSRYFQMELSKLGQSNSQADSEAENAQK